MERIVRSTVARADAGAALAEYLAGRFTYLSAAEWSAEVRGGTIAVNGLRSSPEAPMAAGDVVSFDPGDFAEPESEEGFAVRYEDGDLLVVDKPPNLPVHPSGRYFKRTLWYLLRPRLPEPRIVTRLDRETSGLVLVAKSAAEARRLQALQTSGAVDKRYLALVRGAFPESLLARGVLVSDGASAVRKKRAYIDEGDPRFPDAAESGESCETRFELAWTADGRSLVRAALATGRTHQIRATLRSLGFPVVGDKLYGVDETAFLRFAEGRLTGEDLELLELPRQALHCDRLSFPSSAGGRIEAVSPAPGWSVTPLL